MASFADNYFSRRWHVQGPMTVLLWRDMLGVGTLINLTGTMLALAAIVQDAPDCLAVVLHLLPVPYNLYLCGALWRMPDRSMLASLIAVGWLVAMTLV